MRIRFCLVVAATAVGWKIDEVVGSRGQAPGLLLMPYAVSASPNGSLVVTDTGNSRVQVGPGGQGRVWTGYLTVGAVACV
jgi:hypothetical protein